MIHYRETSDNNFFITCCPQIDKEFLDKQVEEKKQQRELEEARESELDNILLQSCRIGLLLEKQQEEVNCINYWWKRS